MPHPDDKLVAGLIRQLVREQPPLVRSLQLPSVEGGHFPAALGKEEADMLRRAAKLAREETLSDAQFTRSIGFATATRGSDAARAFAKGEMRAADAALKQARNFRDPTARLLATINASAARDRALRLTAVADQEVARVMDIMRRLSRLTRTARLAPLLALAAITGLLARRDDSMQAA